jgi:hypothetical protein
MGDGEIQVLPGYFKRYFSGYRCQTGEGQNKKSKYSSA